MGQPRSTQRHIRKVPEDEERLVERIVALASEYGHYGYRRITVLLRMRAGELITRESRGSGVRRD